MKQTGVIALEKGGEIRLEFFPEDAPKTVENFVTLAKKGFYNGLNFHRVVPDFVVQGGCPKGNGTGGPGYTVKAEFNKQKHVRGSLAMARSQDPDSAGSQFYICYGTTPHLDGQYTVFGTRGVGHGACRPHQTGRQDDVGHHRGRVAVGLVAPRP